MIVVILVTTPKLATFKSGPVYPTLVTMAQPAWNPTPANTLALVLRNTLEQTANLKSTNVSQTPAKTTQPASINLGKSIVYVDKDFLENHVSSKSTSAIPIPALMETVWTESIIGHVFAILDFKVQIAL